MKTGKSLVELATEIQRQAATKVDYLVDTRSVEMAVQPDGGVALALRGGDVQEQLAVSELAHDQIGSWAGIPAEYYDRLRKEKPALLAHNVNTWLREKPAVRQVRALDGRARAFLSDRYRPMDYQELAEAILPVMGAMELEFLSMEVTERRLYIKAVDKRINLDVPTGRRVGDSSHVWFDTISPAIVVSNSEVGCGSLSIETAVWTKMCTNLAVVGARSMKKHHVGGKQELFGEEITALLSDDTRRKNDAALWATVRDVVKGAFDKARLEAHAESLKEAAEVKITADPVRVIEATARRVQLNEGERSSVLRHLIEGGDLTQYGLHAAVTRASAEVESYDRATELERIGGRIITLNRSEWRAIEAEAAQEKVDRRRKVA